MHILVIEDDANHAQFVRDGFVQSGHNVDVAQDGMDGLFMATEEKYDVIVVDRMLPKLDGLTILKTLRSTSNNTPVLILSSLSSVDERIKGLKAGGDDYLIKPFEFGELLARGHHVELVRPRMTEKRRGGKKSPNSSTLTPVARAVKKCPHS